MFPHPVCSQSPQLSVSVGWVCLFQTSVCAVWSWGSFPHSGGELFETHILCTLFILP